jgi:hypothetical protein
MLKGMSGPRGQRRRQCISHKRRKEESCCRSQVFSEAAYGGAQAPGYAELKHHSRLECPEQVRDSYVPPPWDPTPCYLNEKTCHSHYNDTGMGHNIEITYDWKHLAYEDYDRWLYNK